MTLEPPAAIAILGGGPTALEAALYGRFLGYRVSLFAGGPLGAGLAARGAEPLGQAWDAVTTSLGRAALAAQHPDRPMPDVARGATVGDWLEGYLRALAESDLLSGSIDLESQVVAMEMERPESAPVADDGQEAADDAEDRDPPAARYRLVLRDPAGQEAARAFAAVIDTVGALPPPERSEANAYFALAEPAGAEGRLPPMQGAAEAIRDLFAELFGRADLDLYARMLRS